jgi:ribosomal protein L11 methyltransferase
MNEYMQIIFPNLLAEQKDILIAQLADAGYEGFEETENGLEAFINKKGYDKTLLTEISFKYQIQFKESSIENINWNQLWESNFQPVVVNDFVSIRADFHEPVKGVEHEIIITPKMSFGTGHHATTHMMIEQMKEIDFKNKTVFDFGTGTGILAILAEKLGAEKIIAVDNDDWSIENAHENVNRNNCKRISVKKAVDAVTESKSDIILANINRNVITDNFNSICQHLTHPGILLISGILENDVDEILEIASAQNFLLEKKLIRSNWVSIRWQG